jgi:endonuclease/exonuclease/phosphatase family metal-dependent hydrolase
LPKIVVISWARNSSYVASRTVGIYHFLSIPMSLRVLTWNLYHGRSLPPAGRELLREFASRLAAWQWDAALLQEVPPWWPPAIARTLGAEQRTALTSRNAGLAVRRSLARRWPDVLKSNGGGSNAILVRGSIVQYAALRLRTWPERRVAQHVRLREGTCVVNYHASARRALAEQELERLLAYSLDWAGEAPVVVGGDLNLRAPLALANEFGHVAQRDVDHLLARGLEPAAEAQLLDRDVVVGRARAELSDHVPLAVSLRAPTQPPRR